ncbi:hypothetical protein FQR65_LT11454 [Abscondita terminalis]|nr:hypothetical protein FQR65_LT11454 [Abscondita terminalis]
MDYEVAFNNGNSLVDGWIDNFEKICSFLVMDNNVRDKNIKSSLKHLEGELDENFEEVLRQLKSTSVTFNSLMTSPKLYNTMVTVIDNMEPDKLKKASGKQDQNNIAAAFTSKRTCYGCGKQGHIRKYCWYEKNEHQDQDYSNKMEKQHLPKK